MTVVLDASAYLAYAQDEAGTDEVERAMADDDAIMSVNVAEVLTKFTEFAPLPFLPGVVTPLPGAVIVEPFTEVDASLVAALRPITRPDGLSLGDRACLALGHRLAVPVLTADQVWTDLDPATTGAVVRLIR